MKLKSTLKMLLCIGLATFALGCDSTSTVDGPVPTAVNQTPPPNAVYTMTNAVGGNQVQHFSRNSTTGALTAVAAYSTGGNGDGTNLTGSSNALFYDVPNRRVFAVNAGTNTITAMTQDQTTGALTVLSQVASGGTRPISVTASGNVVYVLNAGSTVVPTADANITGFQFNGTQLVPIANSTRALSAANPNPAQIAFSPSGLALVVTERATNNIRVFTGNNGVPSTGTNFTSAGTTPFGFDFTDGGILIVSEANGAAANGSSTSSYSLSSAGAATTISGAIANNQTANCWVAVNPANTFAYTTNTASNNISHYAIASNGALTLQGTGNSATTGAGPVDLGVSNDGQFVYTLNGGDDSISAFQIGANGTLTAIGGGVAANGVPATSVGLIVQ